MEQPTKCCIIGAGLNGLATAKQLKEHMQVTVFEAKDNIGGQWLYTPLTDSDTPDSDLFKQLYGHQQSSIYEGVRLITPAEMTQLEDFPYAYSSSYAAAEEILSYLNEYVRHFDLRPLVKFNTIVTLVKPLSQEEFEVTTKDSTGAVTTEIFNYICVAIGHTSVPYVPDIPGIESFPGPSWHIHNRKHLDRSLYANKTVLLVGAAASTLDKMKFLIDDCENAKVIVAATKGSSALFKRVKDPIFNGLLEDQRILFRGQVTRVEGSMVYFEDCYEAEVDEVIYCTGFMNVFPFLPHTKVSEQGRYVNDLYEGVFDVNFPRIAHMGLFKGLVFFQTDFTSKLIRQEWLRGPDQERMTRELRSAEEALRAQGLPLHHAYANKFRPHPKIGDAFLVLEGNYSEAWVSRMSAMSLEYVKAMFDHYWNYRDFTNFS
jgi:cation diffusion facilitator CzcD-associated flavoprotein CzcO